MDYNAILNEAYQAARNATAFFDDKDFGACGFAWVVLDKRSAFVRWCKKNKDALGRDGGSDHYPKGYSFSSPGARHVQSIEIKEKGARAFAQILKSYGIDCTLISQLD